MTATELKEILEKHKKWLNDEDGGERANLRYADLRGADLLGADLDYSCLPLWCGSFHAHFDDRQIIQILYHAVKAGTESPNVSDELKGVLWGLADTANKFHRVEECGKIERRKDNV